MHAALSDLTPAEVFASIEDFNQEMTDRALVREKNLRLVESWSALQKQSTRLHRDTQTTKDRTHPLHTFIEISTTKSMPANCAAT